MTMPEISTKVKELRELKRMAEELNKEIETIQNCIKNAMDEVNTDELQGFDWRITYKSVTSSRIDTAALKKAAPDVANLYTRTSTTRRFVLI